MIENNGIEVRGRNDAAALCPQIPVCISLCLKLEGATKPKENLCQASGIAREITINTKEMDWDYLYILSLSQQYGRNKLKKR